MKICKACGEQHEKLGDLCTQCLNLVYTVGLDSTRLHQVAHYLDKDLFTTNEEAKQLQRKIIDRWHFEPPLNYCISFFSFIENLTKGGKDAD